MPRKIKRVHKGESYVMPTNGDGCSVITLEDNGYIISLDPHDSSVQMLFISDSDLSKAGQNGREP